MRHQNPLRQIKRTLTTLTLLSVVILCGCAGKRTAGPVEPSFWPQPPSAPRVQYLMSINSNLDVVDKAQKFSLFSFGESGKKRIDPLVKPYGITTSNGKIYLCDSGRQTVFVIDMVEKTFESLKGNTTLGTMKAPLGLTADDAGNILVADAGRKEVLVYDAQGEFLRAIGRGVGMKPTDVGVYGDRIFVCDIKNSQIQVFDRSSGKHLEAMGVPAQELSMPMNLHIDDRGFLHITNMGNGRIVKMDRDGHVVQTFGKFGDQFGHFGRPKGIATDETGHIFVVDTAHQNVQIFNENGRLLMFFGEPGAATGNTKLPAGITITNDGKILEFFQKLAQPNFILENVILVSNHFGNNRLAVYGMGKLEGVDYNAEYEEIKKQIEELALKEKQEKTAAEK